MRIKLNPSVVCEGQNVYPEIDTNGGDERSREEGFIFETNQETGLAHS